MHRAREDAANAIQDNVENSRVSHAGEVVIYSMMLKYGAAKLLSD